MFLCLFINMFLFLCIFIDVLSISVLKIRDKSSDVRTLKST